VLGFHKGFYDVLWEPFFFYLNKKSYIFPQHFLAYFLPISIQNNTVKILLHWVLLFLLQTSGIHFLILILVNCSAYFMTAPLSFLNIFFCISQIQDFRSHSLAFRFYFRCAKTMNGNFKHVKSVFLMLFRNSKNRSPSCEIYGTP